MAFELEDFDDLNKINAIKQFIDPLSDLINIIDCNNHVILINDALTRLSGFHSAKEIMLQSSGIPSFVAKMRGSLRLQRLKVADFRCSIADMAETLYYENSQVIKNAKPLTYISNVYFSDKKSHLLYGNRSPLTNSQGNVIGISMSFSHVIENPLINLAYSLFQIRKHYQSKNSSDQFSFLVTNEIHEFQLTPKQFETLFYLLRGKSSKLQQY